MPAREPLPEADRAAADLEAETALGVLTLRQDVRSLDPNELATLRQAFSRLYQRTGPSGYQALAGIHGEPRWLCPHGSILFIPWHRAYIITLERALRELLPDAALVFWDWTSSTSQRSGIPVEYRSTPLDRAFIGPAGRNTRRAPGRPSQLRPLATQVATALASDSFEDFSGLLEAPHNLLHMWVGGDMQSLRYAAYDPIFWAHHANVDRQWALWQSRHGDDTVTPEVRALELAPFGMTVGDVLDYRALGYEYEGLPAPAPAPEAMAASAPREKTLCPVQLDPQGKGGLGPKTFERGRVRLRMHDVRESEESYVVDVFVNQPEASPRSRRQGNPHFAGSFGIFGAGPGAMPHAEKSPAQMAPRVPQIVDITAAVQRVVRSGEDIAIKLLARSSHGPVALSEVPCGHFTLEITNA